MHTLIHILFRFSFFLFFWVKDDFIKQLNKNNRFGAHPIKIYTIQVFLKNIVNVHRWTNKGNKITFLNSTLLGKQICAPVGLTIAMFKLDLLEACCQVSAII